MNFFRKTSKEKVQIEFKRKSCVKGRNIRIGIVNPNSSNSLITFCCKNLKPWCEPYYLFFDTLEENFSNYVILVGAVKDGQFLTLRPDYKKRKSDKNLFHFIISHEDNEKALEFNKQQRQSKWDRLSRLESRRFRHLKDEEQVKHEAEAIQITINGSFIKEISIEPNLSSDCNIKISKQSTKQKMSWEYYTVDEHYIEKLKSEASELVFETTKIPTEMISILKTDASEVCSSEGSTSTGSVDIASGSRPKLRPTTLAKLLDLYNNIQCVPQKQLLRVSSDNIQNDQDHSQFTKQYLEEKIDLEEVISVENPQIITCYTKIQDGRSEILEQYQEINKENAITLNNEKEENVFYNASSSNHCNTVICTSSGNLKSSTSTILDINNLSETANIADDSEHKQEAVNTTKTDKISLFPIDSLSFSDSSEDKNYENDDNNVLCHCVASSDDFGLLTDGLFKNEEMEELPFTITDNSESDNTSLNSEHINDFPHILFTSQVSNATDSSQDCRSAKTINIKNESKSCAISELICTVNELLQDNMSQRHFQMADTKLQNYNTLQTNATIQSSKVPSNKEILNTTFIIEQAPPVNISSDRSISALNKTTPNSNILIAAVSRESTLKHRQIDKISNSGEEINKFPGIIVDGFGSIYSSCDREHSDDTQCILHGSQVSVPSSNVIDSSQDHISASAIITPHESKLCATLESVCTVNELPQDNMSQSHLRCDAITLQNYDTIPSNKTTLNTKLLPNNELLNSTFIIQQASSTNVSPESTNVSPDNIISTLNEIILNSSTSAAAVTDENTLKHQRIVSTYQITGSNRVSSESVLEEPIAKIQERDLRTGTSDDIHYLYERDIPFERENSSTPIFFESLGNKDNTENNLFNKHSVVEPYMYCNINDCNLHNACKISKRIHDLLKTQELSTKEHKMNYLQNGRTAQETLAHDSVDVLPSGDTSEQSQSVKPTRTQEECTQTEESFIQTMLCKERCKYNSIGTENKIKDTLKKSSLNTDISTENRASWIHLSNIERKSLHDDNSWFRNDPTDGFVSPKERNSMYQAFRFPRKGNTYKEEESHWERINRLSQPRFKKQAILPKDQKIWKS